MSHYLIAMLDGGAYQGVSILSPAGIEQLQKASVVARSVPGQHATYGFGWYQETLNGVPTVRHNGSSFDMHAQVILLPAEHTGVVLLSNAESPLYLVLSRLDLIGYNTAAIQLSLGGADVADHGDLVDQALIHLDVEEHRNAVAGTDIDRGADAIYMLVSG